MIHFSGWDQALERLGLSPDRIRKRVTSEQNSPEGIAQRLRDLHAAGQDLSSEVMRTEKNLTNLYTSATNAFGSYAAALAAAGLDPAEHITSARYQREYEAFITQALQLNRLIGRPRWEHLMHLRKYHARFIPGRFKNSWKRLADELGMPHEKVSVIRYPTKEDALHELALRARQSKANDQATLTREDTALHGSVRKFLGGYRNLPVLLESLKK